MTSRLLTVFLVCFTTGRPCFAETEQKIPPGEYHEQFIIGDLPEGGHLSADGVTIYGGNRTITRPSRLSSSIPPVIAIRKTESVIRTRISS
ncbi:MAG: hypothetical protein P1U81_10140 [Verrucomicrobiales bacterium]|nr:hypothetical protein [Verrucomicrobiales bacterium]